MKLAQIIKDLNTIAPFALALNWDNVGLQIGNPDTEISSALLCLDVNATALDRALVSGANLIISHHPLIFSPLKNISNPLLLKLIQNGISVVSLHTNLDVAAYSVNHCLADALELDVISALSGESGNKWYRLSVNCPPESSERILDAAFGAGAGRFGNYSHCSSAHEVKGSFLPLDRSNPNIGSIGKMERLDELELEFMVDAFNLEAVKTAIRSAHPYETPALYYYPVENANPAYGLGLLCKPRTSVTLEDLAASVKQKLQSPFSRLWTAGREPRMEISKIAICGGSGSSLLRTAAAKADVFISGDFGYHTLLDSPIPIIDAGHLYTEYPVLPWLASKLQEKGLDSSVLELKHHDFAKYLS